ncbi:putative ascorbate-specific transmembrane electron transporter 1 [Tasmannia lanceolata]|uniref:putative ascorbate-specific transmembrane electron transporter 1 n=1 Tax=Tasmannia lanceolata TaxID=3420 RepID=UPI004064BA9E
MATKSGSSFLISATPATVIAHLMGIAIITLVLVWVLHFRGGLALKSENKGKIFNMHPFLMLVGFIFVSGEAIIAYKTIPVTRKTQKFIHMKLHLIALLLGILGIYAIFQFQSDLGIPNMRTLHSWLGMGTICLFALQFLFGFLSFWYPRAATPARLIPWHYFGGMVIFLMAICSAETGLMDAFKSLGLGLEFNAESYIVNFTGIAVLFFGIAITLSVILPRSY